MTTASKALELPGGALVQSEFYKVMTAVTSLLSGLAERRFPCCSVPPAAEVPSAASASAPAPDASASAFSIYDNCLGLLRRACEELEWPAPAVQVATGLLACADLSTVGTIPTTWVAACLDAVRRMTSEPHPCSTHAPSTSDQLQYKLPFDKLPLRPVCGGAVRPLWSGVSKLRQCFGANWPEQVHRMYTSLQQPALKRAKSADSVGAPEPAPKRVRSSSEAESSSSADVGRWSRLHDSLLQRQRTDQAQRAAGMAGMPAGEQEQLQAEIEALAAKLGR